MHRGFAVGKWTARSAFSKVSNKLVPKWPVNIGNLEGAATDAKVTTLPKVRKARLVLAQLSYRLTRYILIS